MSAITHVGTVIVPVAGQGAALAFWCALGFETRVNGAFEAASKPTRS